MLAQQRRHIGQHLFLINTVRIPERVVLDKAHARIFFFSAARSAEDLLAAEHAVPCFGDGFAVEISETWIQVAFVPVR